MVGVKYDAEPMEDDEIVRHLRQWIRDSLNSEDGDISQRRAELLRAWRRDPYGNEREGHAKFVTGEVQEAIEWILPDILEVFAANPRPVEFTPVGPEDEEFAKQETDIVLHMLLRDNNSFATLHDLIKDALLYPNGYAKIFVEEVLESTVEEYRELDEMQLLDLVEQPGKEVELLEQRAYTQIIPMQPPGPGMPAQKVPLQLFDVRAKITEKRIKLRFTPWPPEHMLIDAEWMSLDLDDCPFVCGRSEKTYTALCRELKGLGIDESILDDIQTSEDFDLSEEGLERRNYEAETRGKTNDDDDPSMKRYWEHDCYVLLDVDGDGLAERRHIRMIGDTIILNEEVPEQPYVSAASIRIPHKHTGYAYAELIEKEQKLHTELTRQLLDNIRAINRLRKFVHKRAFDRKGLEALTNPKSSVVPVRMPPAEAILPDNTQNMIGDIMPLLQRGDEKARLRTGMSPDTSLDPTALQRVASEPFVEQQNQKNKRIKMVARILAEMTIKPLMLKAHRSLRRYQNRQVTVQLRGEWVTSMPTLWRERTDLRVNVGLGKVEQEKKVQMLLGLLQQQKELLAMGLVQPPHLLNTFARIVEAMDLGDPRHFAIAPKEYQPPPPPQPDPVQMAQAKALDAQGNKFNAEAQATGMDAQIKAQSEQAKAQAALVKAQMDMERERVSLEKEKIALANERQQLELKAFEIKKRYALADVEMAANVDNIVADTKLKEAQAFKAAHEATRPDPEPNSTQKTQ